MDFDTASDFEINKAVAEALGYECPSIKPFPHTGGNGVHRHRKGNPMRDCLDVDYCNSWADMGPIIESIWWELLCAGLDGVTNWAKEMRADDDSDKLRAACIVFLKMKESSNDHH